MKIIKEPCYICLSEYQRQIELYKKRVAGVCGVISIYLMGSIRSPGLSDIDIIVITEDEFDSALSSKLAVTDLDSRIFLHGPVVVPYSLVDSFQSIIYASNLKCIYGPDCLSTWDSLDLSKRKLLSICYLIDFIESRMLQFAMTGLRPVDKRAWLTRVWSTMHSLFLYKNYCEVNVPEEINFLEKKINKTRIDWVEKNHVEDEVFFDSLVASEKINNFIFDRVLLLSYGRPLLQSPFKIKSHSKVYYFDNEYVYPKYNVKLLELFRKKVLITVARQCPSYLAHIQGYISCKPSWEVEPTMFHELEYIKRKRSELVKQHSIWLMPRAPYAQSRSGYLGVEPIKIYGFRATINDFLARILF